MQIYLLDFMKERKHYSQMLRKSLMTTKRAALSVDDDDDDGSPSSKKRLSLPSKGAISMKLSEQSLSFPKKLGMQTLRSNLDRTTNKKKV